MGGGGGMTLTGHPFSWLGLLPGIGLLVSALVPLTGHAPAGLLGTSRTSADPAPAAHVPCSRCDARQQRLTPIALHPADPNQGPRP